MDTTLRDDLTAVLGSRVESARPLSGGDINQAYRVELQDGRCLFVKANTRLGKEAFLAEARGLDWLRSAGSLRIPEVVAVSSEAEASAFLVLEMLESAPREKRFEEQLGRGLADLHRSGAAGFGLDQDNFIGSLPQDNRPLDGWCAFYRERRLTPQLARAVSAGHIDARTAKLFERLFVVLEERVGPAEPPARLHGDLWGGNLHVGPRGEPCLIDPACYGGHREVDLAMMQLFGGFSERVFAAYHEAFPIAPGLERRIPLYQLYPLLVHVNLFGGGYVSSVRAALASLV